MKNALLEINPSPDRNNSISTTQGAASGRAFIVKKPTQFEEIKEWAAWDFHYCDAVITQIADVSSACFRNIEVGRKENPDLGWTRRERYVQDRLSEATIAHKTASTLYQPVEGIDTIHKMRVQIGKLRHVTNELSVILEEVRLVEDELFSITNI